MDKIDHALLWIMKISLLVLFLTLPHALGVNGEEQNHDQQDDSEFFFHCSGGKLEEVQSALEQHPSK